MDIQYVEMQKWGYSDVLFTVLFGKQDEAPSKIVLQTSLVDQYYRRAPAFRTHWQPMPTT